jgi:hypothetical protein
MQGHLLGATAVWPGEPVPVRNIISVTISYNGLPDPPMVESKKAVVCVTMHARLGRNIDLSSVGGDFWA